MRGKKRVFYFKRGQTGHIMQYIIAEVLIIALFTMIIFNFTNGIRDSTVFEKNYLARSTAMTANTLYAAPGEVVMNNVDNTSAYTINIQDNHVYVWHTKDETEDYKISYWFIDEAENQLATVEPIEKVETIQFIKRSYVAVLDGDT